MKKFLPILLCFISATGFAQVIADPALTQVRTADILNQLIDPHALVLGEGVTLKVPVKNRAMLSGLPSGTCKIKLGLGSKMVLDPSFDLNSGTTSNYFHWTSELYAGQTQVTGDLIAPLPADFLDTATFHVRGSLLGNSTITTNFLVTNHNTDTILSDEDPTNNTSFLAYSVVGGTTPVTFTRVVAKREGCTLKVSFDAEREINVNRYEIEVSKDAVHYVKQGQLTANNSLHYKYEVAITNDLQAPLLYLRIKSLDFGRGYQYSETKTVDANCENSIKATLYPNPVGQDVQVVTISAGTAIFKGRVVVTVFDMAGKLIWKTDIGRVNTPVIKLKTAKLAAGQYLVRLNEVNSGQSTVLMFQKL